MPAGLPAYTEPLPKRTWLAWRPGLDTWIALLSVVGVWLMHLLDHRLATSNPVLGESLLLFVSAILLGTLLPVWIVWHRMRRELDDLGLSLRRMWLAVAFSVVVGIASLPALWGAAVGFGMDPVALTWAQLLWMWEPFFIYAWVQLRMRDGFGEIPAPIIAGICYGLYHLGTEPFADTVFRMGFGIVFGIAFAFTRNLFTLVPISWAMGTALMSVAAGDPYGVDIIALRVVVLVIQVAIVIMAYRRHPGDRHRDPGAQAPDDRGVSELKARMSRDRHRRKDPG